MRGILVGGTDNLFTEVARRPVTGRQFGYPNFSVEEEGADPASFEIKKLDDGVGVSIEARQGNTHVWAALTQELLEEALETLKEG